MIMKTLINKIEQQWEQRLPREQVLISIAGLGVVVLIVMSFVLMIKNELDNRHSANQDMRDTLSALYTYQMNRDDLEPIKNVKITAESPDLSIYVDDIARLVRVKVPTIKPGISVDMGNYRSISADFELRDVSFAQVVELLERIETQDPRVIVNRFNCSVNTRERGQLRKVSIGITTYETIEGK